MAGKVLSCTIQDRRCWYIRRGSNTGIAHSSKRLRFDNPNGFAW
jgi:hypothetical protein